MFLNSCIRVNMLKLKIFTKANSWKRQRNVFCNKKFAQEQIQSPLVFDRIRLHHNRLVSESFMTISRCIGRAIQVGKGLEKDSFVRGKFFEDFDLRSIKFVSSPLSEESSDVQIYHPLYSAFKFGTHLSIVSTWRGLGVWPELLMTYIEIISTLDREV